MLSENRVFRYQRSGQLCHLRGECGIAGNLEYMQTKWHKSYTLEVSFSQLQRALVARERSYTGTDRATPAKLTQTSFSA